MSGLADKPLSYWGPDEWNQVCLYARLRRNCYFPVTDMPMNYEQVVEDNAQHLLQRSTVDVKRGASIGNTGDMLELALRLYTGVAAEQDEDQAVAMLMRVTSTPNVPRRDLGHAFSLFGHIQFERRIDKDDKGCWNIDSLYRAAVCADKACALGFVSPTVLHIGVTVERVGFRRQQDCRFAGWSTDRFEALEDMWRIVDRRKAEIHREQSRRQEKLRKDPNAYICAAPGCGIEGTHKAALQRCAGKCTKEGKPAYCSRECQKKDWKRHKPFCREGAPVDEQAASMRQVVYEDVKLLNFADLDSYQPEFEMNSGKIWSDGTLDPPKQVSKKQEHRLDVPFDGSRDAKLISNTMDPAAMKELKKLADEALERRKPEQV